MALLATLQDDFSSATLNATKWPSTVAGTFSVVSGGLQIVDSTGGYPKVNSAASYDIRNSYGLAQVFAAALSGSNSQQTYFMYWASPGNGVGLAMGGGTLQKVVTAGNTETDTWIADYDPTAMAWWRIRHDGTNITLGYSADGTTWTDTAGFDPGFTYTTTGWLSMMVGRWAAGDTATAVFGNVNIPPTRPDDGGGDTGGVDYQTFSCADPLDTEPRWICPIDGMPNGACTDLHLKLPPVTGIYEGEWRDGRGPADGIEGIRVPGGSSAGYCDAY